MSYRTLLCWKLALAPWVWFFVACLALLIPLSLMRAQLHILGFIDLETNPLITLLGSQLLTFGIPLLCLTAGRKIFASLFKPNSWFDWTQQYIGKYRAWQYWLIVAIAMFAGGLLLAELSSWIIGFLPKHWGFETDDAVAQQIRELFKSGKLSIGGLFVMSCIFAPILEEVFFRGYYHRVFKLWCRGDIQKALLLGAFVFSLVHFSAVGFASRMLIGYALGLLYERTGRLSPSILLHFLNNLVALILLLGEDFFL